MQSASGSLEGALGLQLFAAMCIEDRNYICLFLLHEFAILYFY
jgi:hypothetical protein